MTTMQVNKRDPIRGSKMVFKNTVYMYSNIIHKTYVDLSLMLRVFEYGICVIRIHNIQIHTIYYMETTIRIFPWYLMHTRTCPNPITGIHCNNVSPFAPDLVFYVLLVFLRGIYGPVRVSMVIDTSWIIPRYFLPS